MNRILISTFFAATVGSVSLAADQASPAELKMREALRNTMIQLRTAETERANLQAAQAEMEQKNKDLTAKVEALSKQLADDKTKADKTIAELTDKVAKQDGDIVQFKETVEKWKSDHAKIVAIAQQKEAARAALEEKSVVLERKVSDQQRRNETMYRLGTEILSRYERFGLGDALTAREPFVGITRVKFENLMQDYADKLADTKIKPDPAPSAAKKAKSTPAPKAAKPTSPPAVKREASDQPGKPAKPTKGTRTLS